MATSSSYAAPALSIALLFGIAIDGSKETYAREDATNQNNKTHQPSNSNPGRTESKYSVKIIDRLPKFSLTNQTGEDIGLQDLYGHVWVVSFLHTRCKNSCQQRIERMSSLKNELKAINNWQHTRLVTISVNPKHDTPDVLANYIKSREIDTSQWHFLTGTREAILDLGKKGFNLPVANNKENAREPILDSSLFVLVDWEGRIRGYYDSQKDKELSMLKRDIARVTFERAVYPPGTDDPDWIENRRRAQIKSASDFEVFHNFGFTDKLEHSGIRFRHKMVDDTGAAFKAVHYDHGNAIAVADVDLDGFHDIYFSTQTGSNELWKNLGNGKFENITDSSGLRIEDRIGVGASFADIDNDGDPDLYITNVRLGNLLFENDGKGHFKDITRHSETGMKAHSSGAIFFDYDRDGLLDFFVSNVGVYTTETVSKVSLYTDHGQVISNYEYYVGFKNAFGGHLKPERTETSVLYKNLGNNRFKDVSEEVNLVDSSWSGDATVIDANNDGWPDIYVLNMQGNDEYYENINGETFVRKSRDVFPKTPWGSMGAKSFDYDNDGDMDLYITDMHSDMAKKLDVPEENMKMTTHYPEDYLNSGGNSLFGNAFYLNEGQNQFSEISDEINAENYWPWGLSSGDLNADGFVDVFITSSMNYPFRYSENSLLLNNQGRGFVDSEYILGVEPRKHGITAAPWFEVNCSGRDAGSTLCGNAKGYKVVWGALGSRSSVIFDLDQDGDQDIVTLEFNQPPMVLMSDLSDQKDLKFLKVKLTGVSSNRGGVGATVKVFAGKDIYTKVQDGKSGYLSQSLYPLYFGLGDHQSIKKVEVSWPSGKSQVFDDDIEMNQVLEIKEPG